MSYTITNQCIQCDRCQSACPTGAIQHQGFFLSIDPTVCNNCVGRYSVPQCVAVCPTNSGCIPDVQEFWDRWFVKYNHLVDRLHHTEQTIYWEQWFDAYSQAISKQLEKRHPQLVEV